MKHFISYTSVSHLELILYPSQSNFLVPSYLTTTSPSSGTSRLLEESVSKLSVKRSGRSLRSRSKSATKLGKDPVHDMSNYRLRSKSSSHKTFDQSNEGKEIELDRREESKASSMRLRFMPEKISTSKVKSLLSLDSGHGMETKRVKLSEPYLSPPESEMSFKLRELKSCHCELGTRAALGQFLYHNCLAALAVFLVVLILLLSLPMSLTYRDTPANDS